MTPGLLYFGLSMGLPLLAFFIGMGVQHRREVRHQALVEAERLAEDLPRRELEDWQRRFDEAHPRPNDAELDRVLWLLEDAARNSRP